MKIISKLRAAKGGGCCDLYSCSTKSPLTCFLPTFKNHGFIIKSVFNSREFETTILRLADSEWMEKILACSKLLVSGGDRVNRRVTSGVWGLGLETELPNLWKMSSDVITLKQKCCYCIRVWSRKSLTWWNMILSWLWDVAL